MTRRLRADLSLAFCSLLWGATFVVVKNALGYSSVFVFLAARFTLAALLMAAFRPAGLQYPTPAKSGFVTGSSVVLVPLLLGIFYGRRLTLWVYAGVFAA